MKRHTLAFLVVAVVAVWWHKHRPAAPIAPAKAHPVPVPNAIRAYTEWGA